MFTPIIKNIEEKEYKLAVDALVPLLDEENERVVATAHYIHFIYTQPLKYMISIAIKNPM